MTNPFHIVSEIGKLKSVILKRPGKEVENLTPDTMQELLFDDIPYLKVIQEEHDAFAKVLKDNGADVLYLEQLMSEALDAGNAREEFTEQIIAESNVQNKDYAKELKNYLLTLDTAQLVDTTMAGVRKDEVLGHSFSAYQDSTDESLFLMQPMPNLYYTRDPATVLDKGISLNKMTFEARKRESLYMEYILD